MLDEMIGYHGLLLGMMAVAFANQSFFRLGGQLPVWRIFVEWLLGYGFCVLLAYWLESLSSPVFEQGVVFYGISLLMYLALSFPGVFYRKFIRS